MRAGLKLEKTRKISPAACLEAARARLLKGQVPAALRLLDRGARIALADLPRCMDLLVPASKIAIFHQREDLARRWIGRVVQRLKQRGVRRQPWAEEMLGAIEILKLRVEFSERGFLQIKARIEEAFGRISRWKPWMLEFRWLFLLNLSRFQELEELLYRPPCAIRRGTIEYAIRLEFLGLRFALELRMRPARILFDSALRKMEEVSLAESLYHKAAILSWLSRLETELGSFHHAFKLIGDARAIVQRLKYARYRSFTEKTYGHVCYRFGDYEKAFRAFLGICFFSRARSRLDTANIATAYLDAAKCAIALNRMDRAGRLLSRAEPMVRAVPFPTMRGYFHILKGDLLREKGNAAGYRAAHRHYQTAQEILEGKDCGSAEWGLCLLANSRAALFLKEKNFDEVLEQLQLSMESGKKGGSFYFQSQALLLQSFLLLEKEAPRADLYERILRQLGLVKEPVLLFKILSNLYAYSWDLGDQLELTDLHLKQLDRLRESIPAPIYDKLYRAYVTERVLARFRRRFGGTEKAGPRALPC